MADPIIKIVPRGTVKSVTFFTMNGRRRIAKIMPDGSGNWHAEDLKHEEADSLIAIMFRIREILAPAMTNGGLEIQVILDVEYDQLSERSRNVLELL